MIVELLTELIDPDLSRIKLTNVRTFFVDGFFIYKHTIKRTNKRQLHFCG